MSADRALIAVTKRCRGDQLHAALRADKIAECAPAALIAPVPHGLDEKRAIALQPGLAAARK